MVSFSGTEGIVGFRLSLLRNDAELDARIIENSLVNGLPWSWVKAFGNPAYTLTQHVKKAFHTYSALSLFKNWAAEK